MAKLIAKREFGCGLKYFKYVEEYDILTERPSGILSENNFMWNKLKIESKTKLNDEFNKKLGKIMIIHNNEFWMIYGNVSFNQIDEFKYEIMFNHCSMVF